MSYPQDGGTPPRIRFEAISGAWSLYQQRMGTWILIGIITGSILFAVQMILSFLIPTPSAESLSLRNLLLFMFSPGNILLNTFNSVAYAVLEGAMIRCALKQIRGEGVSVGTLVEIGDVAAKLALAGLITSILATVAGLFCLLPALVVWALLMFAIPLVVDQKMEPLDAVRRSFNMLKSQWLMAFLFNLAAALVSFAGVILCCVGVFLSMPLYSLSIALLYDDFVRGAVES